MSEHPIPNYAKNWKINALIKKILLSGISTLKHHLALHSSMASKIKKDQRAKYGGRRGIRTPGTVSGSAVFKTAALDHSAILPSETLKCQLTKIRQ